MAVDVAASMGGTLNSDYAAVLGHTHKVRAYGCEEENPSRNSFLGKLFMKEEQATKSAD